MRVIEEILKQQWGMWREKSHQAKDRIVSLSLPHIRPMVRGKDGKEVEFSPKALLSWVDGFCFLDYFSFDAYNEALVVVFIAGKILPPTQNFAIGVLKHCV